MRYCAMFAFAWILMGQAHAQTNKMLRTHHDDFFTSRVLVEVQEPRTAAAIKKINEMAALWLADENAQDIITQMMEGVITSRPDSFFALDLRRQIVELNSALYNRTGEKKYRDAMLRTAREGIEKVLQLQSRTSMTPEYMMFLGCRFCDPMFRLDEPVQKNYVDYCEFFYDQFQSSNEITTTTKLVDCIAYGELFLYKRSYKDAIACVNRCLTLVQSMNAIARAKVDPLLGITPYQQVLFLALRTAIMSGDKEMEKTYMGQFDSVLKGTHAKEYQNVLEWTRQRAKNPKPKIDNQQSSPTQHA